MKKEVKELLERSNPDVRELALATRATLRDALPDAQERIYPGPRMMTYGLNEKRKGQFCAIITHKAHVNVPFARGVDLPNPEKLLQGTGKKVRHMKVRSVEDTRKEALKVLIQEAVALTRTSL